MQKNFAAYYILRAVWLVYSTYFKTATELELLFHALIKNESSCCDEQFTLTLLALSYQSGHKHLCYVQTIAWWM